MLTLSLVIIAAIVIYGLGPNWDGAPIKALYSKVVDKVKNNL